MTTNTFPAVGHVFEARFGDRAFHLNFGADANTMRWAPIDAIDFDAEAQTVSYRALEIRPDVFLVTWKEKDETTVTHIEDFERGLVHTNITSPDHQFFNLSGTWTRLR